MLQGSSALHFEGERQIVTPVIRVRLEENFYANYMTPGVSAANNVNVTEGGIFSAIGWKGKEIVLAKHGNSSWTSYLDSYEIDGTTQTSTTLFNFIGSTTNIDRGAFLDIGDTLIFYYSVISGNTTGVRSVSTTNGTAWGDSRLLFGVSGFLQDIVPIALDEMYYLFVTGISTSDVNNAYSVRWKYAQGASSWLGVSLQHERFQVSPTNGSAFDLAQDRYNIRIATGMRLDGEDVLVSTAGQDNISNPGVRLFVADTRNIFEERDIVTTRQLGGSVVIGGVAITDIVKGQSAYYMGFGQVDQLLVEGILNDGANTFSDFVRYPVGVMESRDLKNWSVPHWTGLTKRNFEAISSLGITQAEIVVYSSKTLLNESTQMARIYRGVTRLDLSEHILRYGNNNNDRISLTLGNYGE